MRPQGWKRYCEAHRWLISGFTPQRLTKTAIGRVTSAPWEVGHWHMKQPLIGYMMILTPLWSFTPARKRGTLGGAAVASARWGREC